MPGALVFFKKVSHPGVKPRPFLKPGKERATEFMNQFMGKTLTATINKGQNLPDAVDKFVELAAKVGRETAEKLAPFITGKLAGSVNVKKISQGVYSVGTNVFYAEFVEEGTGLFGYKGQRYLIRPVNKKVLAFLWGQKAKSLQAGRNGKK